MPCSLNLLVTADWRLKITDFGMTRAKAVSEGGGDDALVTQLMTECGTPYWTAPEMFAAKKYNEVTHHALTESIASPQRRVRACVLPCVLPCVRACVRATVRACACVRVRACVLCVVW